MKTLFLFKLLLLATSPVFAKARPHLEFDLRGSDYRKILETRNSRFEDIQDPDAVKLKPALDLGQRNMDFLQFINAHRDAAHQISLTSAETERGFPVEAPRTYNLAITYQDYLNVLSKLPAPLAAVLTGTGPFPKELPIPEAEYIKWGLEIDTAYQMAARWLTLKAWLPEYKEASKDDIRGLYFLKKEPDLQKKLAHWKDLDTATQTQYKAWLLGLCGNSMDKEICGTELKSLIAEGSDIGVFFNKYAPLSQKHYDSYFKMAWPRSDVIFTHEHPEVLRIPFVDPQDARVFRYLKDNIEDEWKSDGWQLRLDFQSGDPRHMSHIEWKSGVTPHVNIPNTIVMDKNQPTTEYDAQWTIRHEFGHILGIPDCYIEFYDSEKAVMVSYQLDISNLMCSRRGHFKQIHLDELKRAYLK